ncbi:ATP synthase epsilon chain [Desulfovibrionales bacterium]
MILEVSMEKSLQLEIITPDKLVLSQVVDYVGAPGFEGEFGVLPDHIPFLSALRIGNFYYKKGRKTYFVFVSGGFVEILCNKVTVLAESAEKAEEIDLERAKKAKERAEVRLVQARDKLSHTYALVALQRALVRMKVAELTH